MTHARDKHLQPDEIAAYVDGAAVGDARALVERHLAICAECRAEVAEVSQIVRTMPGGRRPSWRVLVPAAAAAVLIVMWAAPLRDSPPAAAVHRDETVTTTVAPRPNAPAGVVDRATALRWTGVPGAMRYRVRLFAPDGTMIWERETSDTIAALPDSVMPRAGRAHYWKVEAHTGFDRWVSSELTEFTVRERAR